MTRRRTWGCLLLAVAGLSLAASFTAGAAGAIPTEPGYACGLVDTGVLGAAYGKGLVAEKRPREISSAYGEDAYGSGCTVIVTKREKKAAGGRRSTAPAHRVRVGKIALVTVVAAAGAAGESWSAEAQEARFVAGAELWISGFGGEPYPIDTTFGQSEVHAYLLGSKELSMEAFWRHGESGLISVHLHDRAEITPRLEALLGRIAAGIVPGFSP
jgi:hypothetical protein